MRGEICADTDLGQLQKVSDYSDDPNLGTFVLLAKSLDVGSIAVTSAWGLATFACARDNPTYAARSSVPPPESSR